MILLHLLPAVLSFLVLGAHFLRSGNLILVLGVLTIVGLLGVRRPWAARTAQIALLLGVMEWVRTMAILVAGRTQAGQPVMRMAIILGSVAVVTGLAALPFRGARLRTWFDPGRDDIAESER